MEGRTNNHSSIRFWIMCEMGKYFRFSDSASNVIASNLDVYDGNGNLLLKGCACSDIDWDLINQYR